MAFYERFEWLCGEKGVTPTQAARDVGIRQSVVSMWKKRGSTPKGSTLNRLAKYFEVSTDYLLGNVIDTSKQGGAAGVCLVTGGGNDGSKIPELISTPVLPLTPENLAAMAREHSMVTAFRKLNFSGQQEAVKRVEELTEIPRYQAQRPPQSPPAPQDGNDTTPPPDGSEGPQAGGEGIK